MGTGPTDLYAALEALLEASIEALDTIPVADATLDGAPTRAFVSPALPSYECCEGGQLSVHADAIGDAPLAPGLSQGRLRAGKINHVLASVIIARCVSDDRGLMVDITEPPKVSDLEAAARQTDADIWALQNCLYDMWLAGELFTICGELFFEGARSFMEGGCAGWRLQVRFSLDGYDCLPST